MGRLLNESQQLTRSPRILTRRMRRSSIFDPDGEGERRMGGGFERGRVLFGQHECAAVARPGGSMAVDVATAAFLKQMAENGGKPLHEGTPEEARALGPALAASYGPAPEMARVEEHSIAVAGGEIALRVLVPIEPPRGIFVYYHGGGWVIGDLDTSEGISRAFANAAACIVVSVGYRLAPEHKYPAAVDDAFAALNWVAEHAAEIGGDPHRIAVFGESAGANLSAIVAQLAKEAGGPTLAYQVLAYPVTNMAFDTDSYQTNGDAYYLTEESMRWFWGLYLNEESEGADPKA